MSRILVVDDEDVVWQVIRNVLERPGLYLVYAEDGEKAISLLLSEPFDVLIADKNLPGITGMDVARQAKARDKNMAVLMITAYASRESVEEAMAIGIDDYIVKPFELTDLEMKVSEVIQRRNQRMAESRKQVKPPSLHRNILICEPDEEARQSLVAGVELLGHRPHVVSKVAQILEGLRTKQADALICDLKMLQNDNASACFLRGSILVNPNIRFVVVSAEHGLEGAVEAIHLGAGKVLYRSLLKSGQVVAANLELFLGKAAGKSPTSRA